MKKHIILCGVLAFSLTSMYGQNSYQEDNNPQQYQQAPEGGRPEQKQVSLYDQVNEVRNALNLDHDQFEKVYNAYEKYNKSVFGSSSSSTSMPQGGPGGMRGGGGMGGPGGGGMGGPGGGGMGGPGGGGMGGPGGGGMGGPGGGGMNGQSQPEFKSNSNKAPKAPTQKELEKRQKTIKKQEEKLEKSMKKIVKDTETYAKWQSIRERQLKNLFPPRPENMEFHDEEAK